MTAPAQHTPRTMSAAFEEALRHDVYDLGGGLDGDDCERLFAELDAERAVTAALLAALEGLVEHAQEPPREGPCAAGWCSRLDAALAALAKARGEIKP